MREILERVRLVIGRSLFKKGERMIEEKLKMEHTDKHLLFHNIWVYMVNHNFNKELKKIVSDEEIRMYKKYNLNDNF